MTQGLDACGFSAAARSHASFLSPRPQTLPDPQPPRPETPKHATREPARRSKLTGQKKRAAEASAEASCSSAETKVSSHRRESGADRAKKARTGASVEIDPTAVKANQDGEVFVDISPARRITVREFKGKVLVDIRDVRGCPRGGRSGWRAEG